MTKLALSGVAALALLSGCALISSAQTGQPLNQAQVAQDMQSALFILKTAGCVLDTAAVTAAPIVAISGDAKGQQVLAATDAGGKLLCTATMPPTSLPVPAPANAPAATAAVPAA